MVKLKLVCDKGYKYSRKVNGSRIKLPKVPAVSDFETDTYFAEIPGNRNYEISAKKKVGKEIFKFIFGEIFFFPIDTQKYDKVGNKFKTTVSEPLDASQTIVIFLRRIVTPKIGAYYNNNVGIADSDGKILL
ncbi:MAG: hypothetical protein LBT55_03070 [Clostridiaceae bacterium]|jgi:hypothetical protein|nr:hypothetical protein [Clostridiaceae bacterium]